MKNSLEFKVVAVVLTVLIVGAALAGFTAVYMQRTTIFNVTEATTRNSATIVLKNLELTMLENRADLTKAMVKNLKEFHDIEELTVFNSEGGEAFTPQAPVREADALKELKTGKDHLFRRDNYLLTYYLPLNNRAACQQCHPAEKSLLGAVKVGLSVEHEYTSAMNRVMTEVMVSIVATVCFSFLLWFMLRKMVIAPIKLVNSAALRISEGDLSFDVKLKSEDEIGTMARIFKDSFRTLGSILQRIKDLSGRISRVTDDVEKESKQVIRGAESEEEAINSILSSVEELNATAIQIADSTETLSASVEETSASIEQTVSSINNVNESMHDLSVAVESTSSSIAELSATIKQVASNAGELAEASEETLSAISEITSAIKEVELNAKESARLTEKVTTDAATFGMTSIEKTIEGMNNIKASVEHTADFIKKLGGRSDEIGKILTVIDDITDQTTLLALNAAILAAQAGEHGKGFSVVATEIKDLAERTTFSTQEIASLIQSVQHEVKSAVEAMQAGLGSVEEGFQLSREAGNSLRKIIDSSKQSSEMALSIERSTTEQAKATKLVTEAMERVKNMTDQIAKATAEESKGIILIMNATERMRDASKQVSKATEEQTISSRQISKAMELVSERSKHITKSLSEHKIGVRHILNVIDGVRHVPTDNRALASRINNTLRDLAQDSDLLRIEMERFRFHEEKGSVVRLGVVPLESPAVMHRKFLPLTEYLSKALGKTVELKVGFDFDSALRDLGQNSTQFCFMGAATYIMAQKSYAARILVKALRNGKPFTRSVIITRSDSAIQTIRDIRGKSFAFSNNQAANGYVVPRMILRDAGIELTDLKKHDFLGHADEVAKAVARGEYDAGGVSEAVAYLYKDQGLRFVQFSEEVPEFNVCFNSLADEKDVSKMRTALISLSDSSEGTLVLKSLDKDYTGFVEADDRDYNSVRQKMSQLGLL